jgi:hypothetical protein
MSETHDYDLHHLDLPSILSQEEMELLCLEACLTDADEVVQDHQDNPLVHADGEGSAPGNDPLQGKDADQLDGEQHYGDQQQHGLIHEQLRVPLSQPGFMSTIVGGDKDNEQGDLYHGNVYDLHGQPIEKPMRPVGPVPCYNQYQLPPQYNNASDPWLMHSTFVSSHPSGKTHDHGGKKRKTVDPRPDVPIDVPADVVLRRIAEKSTRGRKNIPAVDTILARVRVQLSVDFGGHKGFECFLLLTSKESETVIPTEEALRKLKCNFNKPDASNQKVVKEIARILKKPHISVCFAAKLAQMFGVRNTVSYQRERTNVYSATEDKWYAIKNMPGFWNDPRFHLSPEDEGRFCKALQMCTSEE